MSLSCFVFGGFFLPMNSFSFTCHRSPFFCFISLICLEVKVERAIKGKNHDETLCGVKCTLFL